MSINSFFPPDIKLDHTQLLLAKELEVIAKKLENRSLLTKLLFSLRKTSFKQGVYLYGGVGRGKTMLMKAFYDFITLPKELIHYQQFMQTFHIKLHKLQNFHTTKIIELLAKDIAARSNVVCLDEFEIKDISDAMIVLRLFTSLLKERVFVFLTTNTKPEDLYKDGIGRESFLPFITLIQKSFNVLCLDFNIDYRFTKIGFSNRLLYPIDNYASAQIQKIKEAFCSDRLIEPKKIEVFSREILFSKTYKNVLFTEFKELFESDFGYADYVNICQSFEVIIIENVREIKEDESNLITRFINFIDNAYFYKVTLFMSLVVSPEFIYIKGSRAEEFKRTVSRLNEMNTEEYLGSRYDK